VKSENRYVCPECERLVVPVAGQSWLARCEAGHRLRVLESRPLWLTGVLSLVVGYFVLSTVIHALNLFLRETYPGPIKACILAAAAVSCVYLAVVGRDYAGRPEPMRSLGRQYVTVAIGRMIATLLVSALAWVDFPA
jgi:hypothetical protein